VQNVEDDIYLTFVFVMFAQILAFYKSVEIGLFPDNPSPEGLVNRVVQGVNIHPYFSSLNKENPLHNKGRRI
jgi:tagatose-6-phosphate ketose/aldose isomerase